MPQKPGVYVFRNKENKILYVGKAKNLKSRVSSYFLKKADLGEKTKSLVSLIEKIEITIVESELEALLLEAFFINKYQPKYNIRFSDDKSYIRIKINKKDKYPPVLLVHKESDPNTTYFGPYPNGRAVRLVLRTIRKAFPYVSTKNHAKRICLYNHLGLCPCPPIFASKTLEKEYKHNIKNIIRIFEGEASKIVAELERARNKYSKNENYEKAKELQEKIYALKTITEPFHKPFEYEINPNLRSDMRQKELNELKQVLTPHLGSESSTQLGNLDRIECYDISNTQGTNATGSMVVLTNGEIDKSEYRRFKIKKDGKPNDFEMMGEMLTRRFKKLDWTEPNLVIVDGGKGQVSSALKTLASTDLEYPIIGLAKRVETIVIPAIKQHGEKISGIPESLFTEISLPKNSKALHLIMRIRDEAHRFAITYHRKLRNKSSFL